MFFKSKKPKTEKVTYERIKTELDELLGRAEVAHVSRHVLVDLLESRAQAIRVKQSLSYSATPRVYSGNLPE
jgi:hypothetical protein